MIQSPEPTKTGQHSNYDTNFPSLQETATQQPKVVPSKVIQPDGSTPKLSQAEAVLNWQTENALAQNKTMTRLEQKLDLVAHQVDSQSQNQTLLISRLQKQIDHLQNRIDQLHQELMHIVSSSHGYSAQFLQKEAEMKSLKTQMASLQQEYLKQKLRQPQTFPEMSLVPNPFDSTTAWPQPSFSPFPKISQPLVSPHIPSGAVQAFGNTEQLYAKLRKERDEKIKLE